MNILATNFSNIEIRLLRQVDAELASDIEKQSVYISTDIDHLHVNSAQDGIVICLKPGADAAAVKDKAERIIGFVGRHQSESE